MQSGIILNIKHITAKGRRKLTKMPYGHFNKVSALADTFYIMFEIKSDG